MRKVIDLDIETRSKADIARVGVCLRTSMFENIKIIKAFDFEVTKDDWLVVVGTRGDPPEKYTVIHNSPEQLRQVFLIQAKMENVMFVGFNNQRYDNYILNAILNGASNETVKDLNDWIVAGKKPWEHPVNFDPTRRDATGRPYFAKKYFKKYDTIDLKQDLPADLSLKAIEGNMNEPIVESSVDFNVDRKLTDEEIEDMVKYCKMDVANTLRLFELRLDYLKAKYKVGILKYGDTEEAWKALAVTNANLCALFLDAERADYDDEFSYKTPEGLVLKKPEYIMVKEHYLGLAKLATDIRVEIAKDIPDTDSEWFEMTFRKKLEELVTVNPIIAGLEHTCGLGGIHGAREHFFAQASAEYKMVDIDVGSYYPSLMIQHDYISRSIPSAEGYKQIYHERIEAKHNGDKDKAGALKLVLNTTYGAANRSTNPLYDPHNAHQVCISGQLFLLDLVEKLEDVEGFNLIQSNTDGLMVGFPTTQEAKVHEIVEEWEARSRMQMEYKEIESIWQKDVNNYIMLSGETYLVKNKVKTILKNDCNIIETKGSWAGLYNGGSIKNNSLVIVSKALVNYLVYGIAPEVTVNEANNIFDFQMILKATHKFSCVIWQVEGKSYLANLCNRVYAVKDERFGKLVRVKPDNSQLMFPELPEHCYVDNENQITLNQVDRQYYIDLAWKRIADFKGEPLAKIKKKPDIKIVPEELVLRELKPLLQKLLDADKEVVVKELLTELKEDHSIAGILKVIAEARAIKFDNS